MDISTAGSLDKNFILELYQRAFSKEERKPFSLIERKAAMGEMEMLLIREEYKPIGFAIVAYGDMTVLLDYLAITEKWRGEGYGTLALELIEGLYSDHQLIVEINSPVHKDFFLKNGMCDTGIEVSISGVRKELLSAGFMADACIDSTQSELLYEKYEQIYKSIYGSNYRNVIKRLR